MRTGYNVFSQWLAFLYTIGCSPLLGLGIRLGLALANRENSCFLVRIVPKMMMMMNVYSV